jgi:hypothetical protein
LRVFTQYLETRQSYKGVVLLTIDDKYFVIEKFGTTFINQKKNPSKHIKRLILGLVVFILPFCKPNG